MTPFVQLSVILLTVAIGALLLAKAKQPLLLSYILAGLLLGAVGLPILTDPHTIDLLSELGIAILLFIIGTHLSLPTLKQLGWRVVLIGLLQVVFTTLFSSIVFFALDFSLVPSVLLGTAVSFSSTIVVLKLLTDQKEEHTLYGRVATGVLLVQDIIVCILLIFNGSQTASTLTLPVQLLFLIAKSLLLLGLLYLIARFVLPKLFSFAAQSPELLFVVSLAWGVAVAAAFSLLGISLEIGALAAGVTLAGSEFAAEISARLKPLRDFFLLLFFVVLGSTIELSQLSQLFVPILLITTVVLLVKPLVTIAVMRRLHFHRQTSFKSGAALAQVSEFSFILLAGWAATDLIPDSGVSIVFIAGILTILISTLLLPKLDKLYVHVSPLLKKIPEGKSEKTKSSTQYTAFVFGYSRVGQTFVTTLREQGLKVLVIDFDPDQIAVLKQKRIAHQFGDASDPEFLATLPLHQAQVIISLLPQVETNEVVLKTVNTVAPAAISIIFASFEHQAPQLYKAGASYVVIPHHHAASHIIDLFSQFGINYKRFTKLGKSQKT